MLLTYLNTYMQWGVESAVERIYLICQSKDTGALPLSVMLWQFLKRSNYPKVSWRWPLILWEIETGERKQKTGLKRKEPCFQFSPKSEEVRGLSQIRGKIIPGLGSAHRKASSPPKKTFWWVALSPIWLLRNEGFFWVCTTAFAVHNFAVLMLKM